MNNKKDEKMTLSQVSQKLMTLCAAILLGATMTIAIPAAHAAKGPYYSVKLSDSIEGQRKIIRGVMIKCADDRCRGYKNGGSPKNMCVAIAREFGSVTYFKAGKREFDAAALAKCNGDKKVQANLAAKNKLATN